MNPSTITRQGFKFRLKPKPKDRLLMAQFTGCCLLVWNKSLALFKFGTSI
ncbi:MAG: hypothetical protein D6756_14405 [Cyanobacteria bacterium J083]|nr:MAG: hypothetical protein D6756_14405 [Cyanobacteria bacterium J083]